MVTCKTIYKYLQLPTKRTKKFGNTPFKLEYTNRSQSVSPHDMSSVFNSNSHFLTFNLGQCLLHKLYRFSFRKMCLPVQ